LLVREPAAQEIAPQQFAPTYLLFKFVDGLKVLVALDELPFQAVGAGPTSIV